MFWFENLFISHAADDADIAEYVESEVNSLDSRSVFRASRVGQIAPGEEWFRTILKELRRCDHLLAILTPGSVNRPWVWFEVGAAAGREIPVVLAAAGDLGPADIPEPLRVYQVLRLDDPAQATEIFKKIDLELRNPSVFAKAIARIA